MLEPSATNQRPRVERPGTLPTLAGLRRKATLAPRLLVLVLDCYYYQAITSSSTFFSY